MASIVKRLKGNKQARKEHMDVGNYKNKQRTLVFSSRGIVHRDRHLIADLRDLLPHARKDTKLDTKDDFKQIPEIAEMKSCNNVIFFEARKHKDLYMWLSRCPGGPTIKFLVTNVHTMSEIKLTGNCLKGTRPILQFDQSFNDTGDGVVMKEMLSQAFGSPKGHPKIKPFVDHIFSFFYTKGRVFFRNYQVSYDGNDGTKSEGEPLLVEIGPRFTLTPIKIFSSSFGGNVIWENNNYISPNAIRAVMKAKAKNNFMARNDHKRQRQNYLESNQEQADEFSNLFA
jgi:ribosome biogenesis protein BRX1